MREIRVTGWGELNDALFGGAWHADLGRFRADSAFRGMPDARFDLRTSLERMAGDEASVLEGHMLRTFRRYAHRHAPADDSIWNWLTLAQHHGLPTRLLDWTFSPYVALHFVTARPELMHVDGLVVALDYVRSLEHLPRKLRSILHDEGTSVFTAEMLQRGAASLAEFDALDSAPFVACYEPPSLDDRIVNQFALFTLMSSPTARLDAWLSNHPELALRLIIPAELKWEVRDKLDQANITERVLFPGLDGLSSWLTRYYRPRRSLE